MAPADTLWLLIASALVLSMQAGFLLVEGGRVRAKNSINVAQKNLTDLVVAWTCFMTVGFYLMYGLPMPDTGTVPPGQPTAPSALHFLYQLGFCGTAVTILSGAVAERMSYRAYLCIVALVAALIYPLTGRLVWGDRFLPVAGSWLGDIGFVDFAGATVVHGTGAWAALVLALVLGPRVDRFDEHGRARPLAAHNAVIALLGTLVLLIGWIGFNGGSLRLADPRLPAVVVHTLSAAAVGALAGLLLGQRLERGVFDPRSLSNGLIGGLVASTAGVHLMSHGDAIVTGALGGLVAVGGAHWLLHRRGVDDPVDVVACHGFAGLVGTFAVAFVAPAAALPAGSRLAQLGVQAFGSATVLVLVGTTTWLAARAIGRLVRLRVSVEDERLGLNRTEHGQAIGTGRLERALERRVEDASLFDTRVALDEDDENAELAAALNRLLERHESALDSLRSGERRFRQLAETSSDWLWETDENLLVAYMTPSGANAANALDELVVGRHLLELLELEPLVHRDVATRLRQQRPTETFDARIEISSEDAAPAFVEVRGVPNRDETGRFTGYRGTITDVSARKAAEGRALFLARHDELTGLANRHALASDLPGTVDGAARANEALLVIGLDLDGFKAVNDAYGHAAGDALLVRVALAIEEAVRPGDRVFRTGGDEFVIVMEGLDPTAALDGGRHVAERVIARVSGEYALGSISARIGASAGIAACPEHAEEGGEVLRMADLALYAAKAAGKGRALVFAPAMDAEMRHRVRMESDLRRAVENEEFRLVYQPLVEADSETLVGFEALLRWQHPEHGEIAPGLFIGTAERLELMDVIGRFVLREACRFAATWTPDRNGRTPRVAVNVSPQQLRGERFFEEVRDALAAAALAPERLELEITEDALVEDFDAVSTLLAALRETGVAIAIDDFGSGRTSLRYLERLPATTLKIDRSFVRHLGADAKSDQITESIVGLGHRLGVTVLAEGVEERSQLALLKRWRCDQAQGYLFARPMDGEAVTALLARRADDGRDAA